MCETAADDIRFGVNTMNLKHLFVAVTAALLVLSSDATKAGQTINDGGPGMALFILRGLGLKTAFFRYRFVCFFDSGKIRFRNRYELRGHTT